MFEVVNVVYVLVQSYCEAPFQQASFFGSGPRPLLILGLNVSMPTMIRHFGRTRPAPASTGQPSRSRCLTLCSTALWHFNWIDRLPSTAKLGHFSKFLLAASNCALPFQASKDDKVQMRIFSIPIAVYFLNLTAVYGPLAAVFIQQGATWMNRATRASSSMASPTGHSRWEPTRSPALAVQLALFAIFLLRFVRTRQR